MMLEFYVVWRKLAKLIMAIENILTLNHDIYGKNIVHCETGQISSFFLTYVDICMPKYKAVIRLCDDRWTLIPNRI